MAGSEQDAAVRRYRQGVDLTAVALVRRTSPAASDGFLTSLYCGGRSTTATASAFPSATKAAQAGRIQRHLRHLIDGKYDLRQPGLGLRIPNGQRRTSGRYQQILGQVGGCDHSGRGAFQALDLAARFQVPGSDGPLSLADATRRRCLEKRQHCGSADGVPGRRQTSVSVSRFHRWTMLPFPGSPPVPDRNDLPSGAKATEVTTGGMLETAEHPTGLQVLQAHGVSPARGQHPVVLRATRQASDGLHVAFSPNESACRSGRSTPGRSGPHCRKPAGPGRSGPRW